MAGTCTDPEGCEKPVKCKGLCAMHYQRTLRPKPETRTCVVCHREFPTPYRSNSNVCGDECRARRERDLRQAADAARVGGPKCADCGRALDSHAALGRCPGCYRRYRRANPEGYECDVTGCDMPRVGDGLCSTHYSRQAKGLPLILEPRECPGCGVAFTPIRDYQAFHTVECGQRHNTRLRLGIEHSVDRVCWWCDKPFKTGSFHQKCCTGECTRMAKSLRDIESKYGITKDDYKARWRRQNGVCAACKKPPETKRARRLHVDHDHACCPGQSSCGQCVRGLLCHRCNSINGHAQDSIELLEANIAYLKATRQAAMFRPT